MEGKEGEGMEEAKPTGEFDFAKEVKGIDTELVDRANELMSREDGEEEMFMADMKQLISDIELAKGNATEKTLSKTYQEMLDILNDFSQNFKMIQEDMAYRGGRKSAAMGVM